MQTEITADYIIIGAGSAGCVLANRLSANPGNRVLLLEAGGSDRNPWIHVPVGYFKTMHNPAFDWCYRTAPDSGLNGRQLSWPRGKVVGGSSSLNGLLYVRGQPEDYDRWDKLGNPGWSYQDILPLFKRAEDQERGADEFHGTGGPLAVTNARLQRPICDAWVAAAQRAGYRYNPDYNGAKQEGVGYFQLTVKRGRRCSAAVAYLAPIKRRNNLRLITRAHVVRLVMEGKRVVAVQFARPDGKQVTAKAGREVIVAAGAIGSPQLLMLSGIGDSEHLKQHNIKVERHLPGVGKNLQDHLQARLVHKTIDPTLNDEVASLFDQLRIGLQYLLFRHGPMTMAASLATAFLKTKPALPTPDIQFHIQPWSADSPGEGVHKFSAFTSSVCQLRPTSQGEIRLADGDYRSHPTIMPNYLASEKDQKTIISGVKIARKIAEFPPLADKIASEFQPGSAICSDAEILDWVRSTATTIYHQAGTCKMGADRLAVVDCRLRVHGIAGLRVADCSIMPEIVSGNTNAPAIMIGEKASDLVLADAAV